MTTNQNKKKRFINWIILFLLIITLLIPFVFIGNNNNSNYNYSDNSYDGSYPKPKMQLFSIDQYNPILEEEKYSLGSINVTDIHIPIEFEKGFNSTKDNDYNEYNNDLTSKALNMTYKGIKFIKTEKIAQVDNLNENIIDCKNITVKLNETLSIQYNETKAGYLIYAPRLTPYVLDQLLVKKNTGEIKEVPKNNYSERKIDKIKFLYFDFQKHFNKNSLNFTMHMIWHYNFTIDPWRMSQYTGQKLIITEEENIVYPKFNYYFQIKGYKYNQSGDNYIKILDNDLLVNLTIDLPDKTLLSNHNLKINDKLIPISDFLSSDMSVYWKDEFILANGTTIDLDFNALFEIEFIEPVDYTWGIDRLVEDQDIRERIYFPTIKSGPSKIYLKYAQILEETIAFDQVISSTSLFKRPLFYAEINISEVEEEGINSLIFHQFATKRQGIKITLPYIVKNEICPFIIKYETTNDLRVVITDNINMPLQNLEVRIYYYGEKFGTYISKEKSQPIGTLLTDENGEIFIEDVPNGNYTIKIYQGEELIKKAEVSAFLESNYVKTKIFHIPFLILIFGGISAILIGLGLKIYRKREI